MVSKEDARVANINRQIAEELGVREQQVAATVELLNGGATVPFVARYRKEITGGLDDAQLRTLEERLTYLRELEERRTVILNSIRDQGKLDAALEAAIMAADNKGRLEDIYLPFKPKRRTKAEIAREAGLEPLSELLLTEPSNDPKVIAESFVNADKQVADVAAALDGARCDSGRALCRGRRPDRRLARADVVARARCRRPCAMARRPKARSSRTISNSANRCTSCRRIGFSRCSAARRKKCSILRCSRSLWPRRPPRPATPSSYELKIMHRFNISDKGRPGDKWLSETARWAWRTKIQVHLNIDLRSRLWAAAEQEGVRVFASNLRDLLLAAPAGARVTMGLDPGYRSGVKTAIIDATGKVVATTTIYPHEPQRAWDASLAMLGKLAVAA